MVDKEVRQLIESQSSNVGHKNDKNPAVKNMCIEREDPSEFITHRAKGFLSRIKDIEHRFVRAFESGGEVSRLLEPNKIKLRFLETLGQQFAAETDTSTTGGATQTASAAVKNDDDDARLLLICGEWIPAPLLLVVRPKPHLLQ
ncbi:hypothetical protein SESBI_43621 [Sesbania bispinosa]|nr:hypothetical protein SESBI_43621 [Sesbania bispinosa]